MKKHVPTFSTALVLTNPESLLTSCAKVKFVELSKSVVAIKGICTVCICVYNNIIITLLLTTGVVV